MLRSSTQLLRRVRALSTSTAAPREGQTTRRIGTVLFGGVAAGTGCLCAWQLNRYGWKVNLIAERTAKLNEPPTSLASDPAEYTHVALAGEFDHGAQQLLGPRSPPPGVLEQRAGAPATGWDVLTPLACADGRRVLVNRGWVPREAVDAVGRPAGAQAVRGVVRRGESPNKYVKTNGDGGRWMWLDLPTIARAARCDDAAVVYALADGGETREREAAWPLCRTRTSFLDFYVMPSTHLVYAATWGSLAAIGAVLTRMRFR